MSKSKAPLNFPQTVRVVLRSITISFLVIFYLLVTSVTSLLVRDRYRRLSCLSTLVSFFSTWVLRVMGVRVNVTDTRGVAVLNEPVLVVSNHLSYLDIFVISSVIPVVFVAARDGMQDSFFIRTITKLSGSIFVERKRRTKVKQDLELLADILSGGINLVLFPESTTTRGDTVTPFKSSFFDSALKLKKDVLLVCLKYVGIDGQAVNDSNRELISFQGDVNFFHHFFRLLSFHSVDVDLFFVDRIKTSQKTDRKQLSRLVHSLILECYRTV